MIARLDPYGGAYWAQISVNCPGGNFDLMSTYDTWADDYFLLFEACNLNLDEYQLVTYNFAENKILSNIVLPDITPKCVSIIRVCRNSDPYHVLQVEPGSPFQQPRPVTLLLSGV